MIMKKRILLVEPDAILAKIYQNTLITKGYDVCCAADAQIAIRLLDQQPFELIILELQLINHGGVEFIYELRSYGEWSKIPIILHTIVPYHALSFTKLQRRQLGIAAYLYKPVTTTRQLLQSVEAVLLVAV